MPLEKLTTTQKMALLKRIRDLDPHCDVVALTPDTTYTGGSVAYNTASGLTLHQSITRLTDEEYVRAHLVVRLIKELGYPADSIELEHQYTIGRPSPTRAKIDVRVMDRRSGTGKPTTFMLIEAKRPDDFLSYSSLIKDQLFSPGNQEYANGLRYTVWYTVEFRSGSLHEKSIAINFRKHHDHAAWVQAGEPGHNLDIPREYGDLRKTRYVKGETDLRRDVALSEFEVLRRDFHNVLWGGAKMGDTDVFNNLTRMFLAKIHDEKSTEEGHAYTFQVDLKNGESESPQVLVEKVNRLYRDALQSHFGYSEDEAKLAKINENRFPPNKVAYVFERLEDISLTQNELKEDVLGFFFEAIVRTGFKQEKGQFFSHSNIVRFILWALELDKLAVNLINAPTPRLPNIIDPSCGSGTFLIEAMNLVTDSILNRNKDLLKKSQRVQEFVDEYFVRASPVKNVHNRWARFAIFGIDANEDLVTATKVNMILHGDGNANILRADGLDSFANYEGAALLKVHETKSGQAYPYEVNEQFDVVVSNPPFSLKEEERTLAGYKDRFAYSTKKNSENLFIERWYQLLREGGRLGVVLPDSVFDTSENLYIRAFLFRFFHVRAIISLPPVAFQPYTQTKTSLLFAVKKSADDVASWDNAWRKASNEYGKLRKAGVIQRVLENESLRGTLVDLSSRAGVDWFPSTYLVDGSSMDADVRSALADGLAERPTLLKRLESTLTSLDAVETGGPFSKIKGSQEAKAKEILHAFLRGNLPDDAGTAPLGRLIEASYEDIIDVAKLDYAPDDEKQPYTNTWWVFSEVTSKAMFNPEVFFAEADGVGYKRTTRHPDGIPQPNDLFVLDDEGRIVVNTDNPASILDLMRAQSIIDG